MKHLKILFVLATVTCLFVSTQPLTVWAGSFPHPSTYAPTPQVIEKQKNYFDDPRPILTNFGPDKVCPEALVKYLQHDEAEMKAKWAEIVGFKAPDVVNKIAPDVKPGKYTWQQVQGNPQILALLPDPYKSMIKEPSPPHVGAIPEIEIVPTKQYYWSLPISKATQQNMGKTKLDENGYLVDGTYDAGIPFPRPSGKFKAQQILYNRGFTYTDWGVNMWGHDMVFGFNQNVNVDYQTAYYFYAQRFSGRIIFEPFGYLNNRAKKRSEKAGMQFDYQSPRDIAGQVYQQVQFNTTARYNDDMIYVPSMRRIRKLSATDTQDPFAGLSSIYDDVMFFNKKISPDRYPMTCKVLEEREYLVPAPTETADWYFKKENGGLYNLKFERRPLTVIEITEVDPNYVYSRRILYADRESTVFLYGEYYDQKGRKYRTMLTTYGWLPKMGILTVGGSFWHYTDSVDLHSEIDFAYYLPADWPEGTISLRTMLKRAR